MQSAVDPDTQVIELTDLIERGAFPAEQPGQAPPAAPAPLPAAAAESGPAAAGEKKDGSAEAGGDGRDRTPGTDAPSPVDARAISVPGLADRVRGLRRDCSELMARMDHLAARQDRVEELCRLGAGPLPEAGDAREALREEILSSFREPATEAFAALSARLDELSRARNDGEETVRTGLAALESLSSAQESRLQAMREELSQGLNDTGLRLSACESALRDLTVRLDGMLERLARLEELAGRAAEADAAREERFRAFEERLAACEASMDPEAQERAAAAACLRVLREEISRLSGKVS